MLLDLHTDFSGGGEEVWYSHLLKNFPQFVVIHTVKGFGIVNKAEVDVFLVFSCFFDDPVDVGNLITYLIFDLDFNVCKKSPVCDLKI